MLTLKAKGGSFYATSLIRFVVETEMDKKSLPFFRLKLLPGSLW